nr:putative transposase [Ipomoea batatas]
MLYVLAKDISPQSYRKAIRLRLIRTYTVTEGRNKSAIKSQECLFHDIEVRSGFQAHTLLQKFYSIWTAKSSQIFRNSLKGNCSPLRSISVVSYGHSANNSQSPMVVSTIRDLYERAEVPTEFEQLRNKSMVFRINLKNEHIRNPAKPISVLSVIHNEELEAQYCPSMVDDHDELSRMVEEDADDLESDAISPSVQADLKLKGVDKAQDEVDTGAIKRCLLDQFSSSQNLKKSRLVVIKQEKN